MPQDQRSPQREGTQPRAISFIPNLPGIVPNNSKQKKAVWGSNWTVMRDRGQESRDTVPGSFWAQRMGGWAELGWGCACKAGGTPRLTCGKKDRCWRDWRLGTGSRKGGHLEIQWLKGHKAGNSESYYEGRKNSSSRIIDYTRGSPL